ncbi:MAG: hypothetical protein LC803_09480 [Acidobacteria bacterium]|nr:hypothetical protein [Acidobacteriota bacterium]
MSKRYDIEKITDIFAIPEESFDNFLVDLRTYYNLGRSLPELIEAVAESEDIKVKAVPSKMTWIDDGEHNANIYLKTDAPREE